jgi:hypothetical protein
LCSPFLSLSHPPLSFSALSLTVLLSAATLSGHTQPHPRHWWPSLSLSISRWFFLSALSLSTHPDFNSSVFDFACLISSMKLGLWMSINSGDCSNLISLPFILLVEYQIVLFCSVFNFSWKNLWWRKTWTSWTIV